MIDVTQAEVEAALETFNGGMVNCPNKTNPRGYTTYYLPKQSMKAALEAFANCRSKDDG